MGNSLLLTLPEVILSIAALALMMVAAYAGDRSARVVTWLAVISFALATLFVPGVTDAGGTRFGGLYIGDSFSAFSKILVYAAAAVALIAASGWFSRER